MSRSLLFVRRTLDVAPEQANRCDGVIVAVRNPRGKLGRNEDWWERVTCEKHGFWWFVEPLAWNEGQIAETCGYLRDRGAVSICMNIEPRGKSHDGKRWEDGYADDAVKFMALVVTHARRCGLRIGFSSWAWPQSRRSFPWREFMEPADYSIPQPYEVHGRSGQDYINASLGAYQELGSLEEWLGRGAHELDKSDDDAWRTPAEIAEHRATTPPGMPEVWWLPRGRLPSKVLDAILEPGDLEPEETDPQIEPSGDRLIDEARAMAHRLRAGRGDVDYAATLLEELAARK